MKSWEQFGKELWENFSEIFRTVLWHFGRNWISSVENLVKNVEKNVAKFWEYFGYILEENWWNIREIGEILRIHW